MSNGGRSWPTRMWWYPKASSRLWAFNRTCPPSRPIWKPWDLEDRFLLPGLVNFHAHACLPGDGTSLIEAAKQPL